MTKGITHVGLDVHARSISLALLPPGASVPIHREIPNEPKTLRRTLGRMRAGTKLRCCYEAGPCGYEVQRLLTEMGIGCEVVAPALIPSKPGDRVKTDRRDAVKLARLYRAGELTPIRVPTPDEEAVRDVVRAREDVRRDVTAARQRLSKFLLRHGRVYSQGTTWTQRHWRWLRGQIFDRAAARTVFEHYVLVLELLLDRLAELEKEIVQLAGTTPYRDVVERLSCLRGMSHLRSMSLLAEIQDFRRFDHPRALMGFVGLVPSERSSGQRERRGRITKTGNSHARRLLIEAAWAYRHKPVIGPRARAALAGQPPDVVAQVRKAQIRLYKRYTRLIGRGKRSQLAVTAVARELCGFIWALTAGPQS